MAVNLKDIKVQSQNTFSGVTETSDDKLYFVEAVVIVKTYHSGTNWYRIYSDGWCEQGGQTNSIAHDASATVVFEQPFIDSDYMINITGIGSYSSSNSSVPVVTTRAYNNFTIRNGSSTSQSFMWEAKGYIS